MIIIVLQICIVTGPNQNLAIKLIKKLKGVFEPKLIYFNDKEKVLNLSGCTIEAVPSNPRSPGGLMESIKKEPEDTLHIQKIIPRLQLRNR
jgi:hypothetical protein